MNSVSYCAVCEVPVVCVQTSSIGHREDMYRCHASHEVFCTEPLFCCLCRTTSGLIDLERFGCKRCKAIYKSNLRRRGVVHRKVENSDYGVIFDSETHEYIWFHFDSVTQALSGDPCVPGAECLFDVKILPGIRKAVNIRRLNGSSFKMTSQGPFFQLNLYILIVFFLLCYHAFSIRSFVRSLVGFGEMAPCFDLSFTTKTFC